MKQTPKKLGLKAFGLIESLISITLFALTASIFSMTYVTVNQSLLHTNHEAKAQRIITETIEAVRSIRDQNFLFLTNGTHGLQHLNGRWSFLSNQDVVDGFYTRSILISDVYRDINDNIDPSGGTFDPRTKLIDITISWSSDVEGYQERSTEYSLSDFFAFDIILDTEKDWSVGIHNQTRETDSNDGSLISDIVPFNLGWINFYDYSIPDVSGIDVSGLKVYAVGAKLVIWDITVPSNIVELSNVSVSPQGDEIAVHFPIAYILSKNDSEDIRMYDISDPSLPIYISSFEVDGVANSLEIDHKYQKLYIGTEQNSGSEFLIYDIQTPSSPILLGAHNVNGNVNDIAIKYNTAFLANSLTDSFIALDVSDPSQIFELSRLAVTADQNGSALAYRRGFVSFGVGNISDDQEFKVIDVRDPSNPIILAGIELGKEIRNIGIYNNHAYVTTANPGGEPGDKDRFHVIDVKTPSNPFEKQDIGLSGNARGVVTNENGAYVLTNYLNIFTHETEYFFSAGNYDSVPIDSGSDSNVWHSFNWEGIATIENSISFQIRTADTEQNLNVAEWVGPDGSAATFYDEKSSIITTSPSSTGNRWLQLRIYLESDSYNTPEIQSLRIQYSQ